MEKARETKEVVVSIHDVSPVTWRRTQEILGDLRAAGVRRASLLVIPDHHHRGAISADPDFRAAIAAACGTDYEAVLHGYFHLRPRQAGEGLWKKFVTRSYTAGEGEFLDLTREQAAELLAAGLEEFARCGLRASGFIAPAWLLGADAERAVKGAGLEYTTRISTVVDWKSGTTHRSRSLVWSVRAGWRRACSLAWNHLLFRGVRDTRLMRIGIHPPDWDHPAIRRQILSLAGMALAGREAMTYEGWLHRMRSLT